MEFSILNLLLVLLVAWLAGRLADWLGYPSVLGELIAGILLGPPLLGWLDGGPALQVLAEVGILLMMCYIGMEIDLRDLGKASKGGVLAALGGFLTPFVLCYLLVLGIGGTHMAALFVGIAAGVTSLATKSRILVDLNLLDTRIAHVMMAGALVADTLSLIIFAGLLSVAEAQTFSLGTLGAVAGKAVAFFVLAALIGWKGFPLLGQAVRRLQLGSAARLMFVVVLVLAYAELAELGGMHGILGAFVAGLFLREGLLDRNETHEVVERLRDSALGFLAPIFFVTAGFGVSLDVFSTNLWALLGLIALATVGKIVGTALWYLPTGHGWREGIVVGAGMNGRGAVEIIIAQIGLSYGLITQDIFSMLVFMALSTTATVPVLLKLGVDWLERRGELVRAKDRRHGTLIVGAGPMARALGRTLARTQPVWMVDVNRENLALAQEDGLETINGSALDEEILEEAQAATAQHFVAITPNAEVNVLAAQVARSSFLIPNIFVPQRQTGNSGQSDLLDHLQSTTLFGGPFDLAEWDYLVQHEQVARQSVVLDRDYAPGKLFDALQPLGATLPLVVERNDQYLPFHGALATQKGDRVILLQQLAYQPDAFDRFDQLVAHAPLLDLEGRVEIDTFFETIAGPLGTRLQMQPARLAKMFQSREDTGSTVVLPGLAIPHIIVPGEGRFEILIARARQGVVFSDQEERVHALFVLAGSLDERNFHLRVLSAIAQIAQNAEFEHDWLQARDAEAVRRLILHAPRRRMPTVPSSSSSE